MTVRAAGGRLDRVLADLDPELSRSAAGRLARGGLVTVNGRPGRPADSVRVGDVLEYEPPEPEVLEPGPQAIALDIVHDDPDLVVIDKPAGMVVHPAAGHHSGTLVHALLGLGGAWSTMGGAARPGIVHRLDKGTSGLILAARTDQAHRALAAQLADRTLSRTYLAIVRGAVLPADRVVEGPIGRHPRDRVRMAVVEGGRAARTRVRAVEHRGGHTLVQCELDTGRTHQIRVHLAALGHPVAGDDLYGRRRPGDPERPMLHAHRLRFRHPRTGDVVTFESPAPADFAAFWERLR
ncbi:MAG TPA: RluA family pseudouridine synthase [Candidatus Dormibacteraeota bacterium]